MPKVGGAIAPPAPPVPPPLHINQSRMIQTKKPEPLVNLLYLNFSSPMENSIIYYILYLKVLSRSVDFERTYRCGQNTKYMYTVTR